VLVESGPVRPRRRVGRLPFFLVLLSWSLFLPGRALAQQVNITPEFSVTPSSDTTPWIFQMAIGVAALGVLIFLFVLTGYIRFAPRFFGRERAATVPPGARPRLLATTSGRPPGSAVETVPGLTGTAAATRVAPEPRRESPVAERAAAPTEVAAQKVTERPTAPPAAEQAVQEDAAGQAEAAAPELRPSAKTREETGDAEAPAAPEATAEASRGPAPSGETPAGEPTVAEGPAPTAVPAGQSTAAEASTPAVASAGGTSTAERSPAPAAAAGPSGAGGMDQETFDRVLTEQLGKGVDKRVAEGRARAAAVVAARRKAQS
jgi:hypothetical protein